MRVHGLWASLCTEGCVVQRDALSVDSAGAGGMQSGSRHIVLAQHQGALCLFPSHLLCGIMAAISANAQSTQRPASVSFEVSADGTMVLHMFCCREETGILLPAVFICLCRGRKEP